MAITLHLHMKKKTFFFVSFAFLLIIQQETASASTISSSIQALLKWKKSLINSTAINDSWSDVTNPCNWSGIYCYYSEIIIKIDLSHQSLNGTLDEFDFSAFPNLTYLHLDSNSLFGEIPIQIGSLSKLTSLYLSNNYFTGSVQRAQAEACKRAASEARERVERIAAEARVRAAAVARENKKKNESDLESFFGMGARPSSAPWTRTTTPNREVLEVPQRPSTGTPSSMRKASSTTKFGDDFTSIFGGSLEQIQFQRALLNCLMPVFQALLQQLSA